MLFGKHLEEDEVVSALVHAHWLVGTKELVLPLLSTLLSLTLFSLSVVRQTSTGIVLLLAGWGVFSIVWALRAFFDYYLDVWIITDKGIIDLEWHGWFHRESSRILYSDIQGVSYEIKGVFSTVARYGTVSVEKISTGSAVSLPFVHRPQEVESLILRNMEAYLHTKNMKDSRHVQDILAGIITQNVQLEQFPQKKTPAPSPSSDGEPAPKKRKSFTPRKI
jgi:hypothetical protein